MYLFIAIGIVLIAYNLCVIIFDFLKSIGILYTGAIGVIAGGIMLVICTYNNLHIACKFICGIYMFISLFAFLKGYMTQNE